jgi:hypothetical protein
MLIVFFTQYIQKIKYLKGTHFADFSFCTLLGRVAGCERFEQ